MIHLTRLRDNTRKVVSISEVLDVKDGEVELNPLYEFIEEGETETGVVLGELRATGNSIKNKTKAQLAGIKVEEPMIVGEQLD